MSQPPPAPFTVRSRREGPVLRLELRGELDMAGVPELERAIDVACWETDCDTLVVDLTSLAFVDSSGLRSLILAHRRMREDGRALEIVNVTPQVLRVFEISGLLDQLPLRST